MGRSDKPLQNMSAGISVRDRSMKMAWMERRTTQLQNVLDFLVEQLEEKLGPALGASPDPL